MTVQMPVQGPADRLQARIAGRVLTPQHEGYADACQAWNLSYRHRPAVVVVPTNAADVSAAVRHARAAGLPISVQTTGHGVTKSASGCMLISTSALNEVSIDGDTWTARIGGGAKWEPVLESAQAVGLAPLLGSTPDVGAVGYTLGGGMGWLARKYGLNADHVRWMEVVTADGEIRLASEDMEAELFWALLGGGAGSLGVVTAMEVDLVPVTSVYAGNLLYPAADAMPVLAHYRDWIASAPDELTSSIVFMNFPPVDEVPEFIRGRSFAIVRGCYAGEDAGGEELLRHWRDWQTPEFDLWGPMPFSQVAMISNDPVDPIGGMSTSEWLVDLRDTVGEILVGAVFTHNGPPPLLAAEVRHAGAAIARPSRPSSYGNRDAVHLLQMVGIANDTAEFEQLDRFVEEVRHELSPFVTGGAYLNFLEGEDKQRRTERGFDPGSWERLRAVKADVDPDNVFNHGLPLA